MLLQSTSDLSWLVQKCACVIVMCSFLFTLHAEATFRSLKKVLRADVSSSIDCTRICQRETLRFCPCLHSVHKESTCLLTIDCEADVEGPEDSSSNKTLAQAFSEILSQGGAKGNDEMQFLKDINIMVGLRKRYESRDNDATIAMKKPRKPRKMQKRETNKTGNMPKPQDEQLNNVEAIRTALHKAVEKEFYRKDNENALVDDLDRTLKDIKEVTKKGYSPQRHELLEKLEKRKHKLKSDLSKARKRLQEGHRNVENLRQLAGAKAKEPEVPGSKERTPLLSPTTSTPASSNTEKSGGENTSEAQSRVLQTTLKDAIEEEFTKMENEQSVWKQLHRLKKEFRRLNQGPGFVAKIKKLEELREEMNKVRLDLQASRTAFHEAGNRVADLREQLRQANKKTRETQTSKLPSKELTSPPSPSPASSVSSSPRTVLQGHPSAIRTLENALKNAADDDYAKEDRKLSLLKQLRAVKENVSRTMQGPNDTKRMLQLKDLMKEESKLMLQLSVARRELGKSKRKAAHLQRKLLEARDEAEAFKSKVEPKENGTEDSMSEITLKSALQQTIKDKPFNPDGKTDQSLHFSKKAMNRHHHRTEKAEWSRNVVGKANKSKSPIVGIEVTTRAPPGTREDNRKEKTEAEKAQRPGVVSVSAISSGSPRGSVSSYFLGLPMAKFAPDQGVQTTGRRRKVLGHKSSPQRKNRFGSRIISTPKWLKHLYDQAVQQAIVEKDKSLLSYVETKEERDMARGAALEDKASTSAKHVVKADHRRRDFMNHVIGRDEAVERAAALQAILDTFHGKHRMHRSKRYVTNRHIGSTLNSSLSSLKTSFQSMFARDSVKGWRTTRDMEVLEQTDPLVHRYDTWFEMKNQKLTKWKDTRDNKPVFKSGLNETEEIVEGSLRRSKRSLDNFGRTFRLKPRLGSFAKTFSLRARRSTFSTGKGHKVTRRDEDDANRIRALSNRTFVQLFKDVAKLMEERAVTASEIKRAMVKQATARKSPVNLRRAHMSKLMEALCEKQREEAALRVSLGKILGILVQGEGYLSIEELIEKTREAILTTVKAAVLATKATDAARSYATEVSDLVTMENQSAEGEDGARRRAEADRDANRTSIALARSLFAGVSVELASEEVKIWKEIGEVLEKRAVQRGKSSKEAAIAEGLKQHAEKQALLAQVVARKKQAQANAVSAKLDKILSKESASNSKENNSRTKEVAERARLLDLAVEDALKKANSSRQRADLAEFIAGLFAEGSTAVRLYELLAKQAQFVQQRADGAALEFDLQKKEAQLDVDEAKAADSAANDKSSGSNDHIASLATTKAHLSTHMVALMRKISQLEMIISRRLSKAMRQDLRAQKAPEMLGKAAEEAHTEAMKAKVAERRVHLVEDQLGSRSSKEVLAEAAVANKSLQLAKERAREAKKAFVMTKHLARTAQNLAETPDIRPRILYQADLSNSSLSKEEILKVAALQAEEQAVEEQHVADMLLQDARRLKEQAAKERTAKAWENADHARYRAGQAERRARLAAKEAQFALQLARKVMNHPVLPSLHQVKSHHSKTAVKEAMKMAGHETRNWVARMEELKASKATNASDVSITIHTGSDVRNNRPTTHLNHHAHVEDPSKTAFSAILQSLPWDSVERKPQTDIAKHPGAAEALQKAEATVQRAESEAKAKQVAAEGTLRNLEDQERRFNGLSLLSKAKRVGQLEKLKEQADVAATRARASELNLVAAQAAADAAKEVWQELDI